MQFTTRLAMLITLTAALGAHASAGLAQNSCSAGATPAATLLVPYFEVNFAAADRQTTLFAVTNAGAQATLAKVVVWTDWGVPTLTFDLFLAPDDVQSINLRDVFNGVLPQTGGGSFTGCADPLVLPVLDAHRHHAPAPAAHRTARRPKGIVRAAAGRARTSPPASSPSMPRRPVRP